MSSSGSYPDLTRRSSRASADSSSDALPISSTESSIEPTQGKKKTAKDTETNSTSELAHHQHFNVSNSSDSHLYKDKEKQNDLMSDSASHSHSDTHRASSEDNQDEPTQALPYDHYTMDGDVIERIKSRASVTSERHVSSNSKEKYKDGLFTFSEDDCRRPQNWPLRRRLAHTVAFGVTTLTAQLGASAMSPAIVQLSNQFNVGIEVGTLAFSVFLLGNTLGPALFAPVSEVYGRKLGILVPCFIGGVFQCVTANVQSIAAVVVFRFLSGVFAAAPIAVAGGAMADLWRAEHRAAAMVLYAANIIIGASGSPALGALLVDTGNYGWRWTCWLGGLSAMSVSAFNSSALSETYLPVIEQTAARNKRLDTGFWGLHSDHDKWHLTMHEFATIHSLRPILMSCTPIVILMASFASFVFGLLYSLITTVGDQFRGNYGFSHPASYCPLFGFCIGYFIGGSINVLMSRRYAQRTAKAGHKLPPEERLPAMMLFGWFLPAGMFLYGWTMRPNIHWMSSTVGLGMVGVGLATIFQGCLVYLTDVYTKYAASVIAANTILRSIFGGVFPLFSRQMFNRLNIHWGSSLLGFVGFALVPVPWIFYIWGHKIRRHDPFRRQLAD